MRVCHLITNPYTLDTRVRKECATLRDLGCDVAVVGTMGRGRPRRERDQGVRVFRVCPEEGTLKKAVRLIGLATRDRFGGTALWPLILRAGRIGKRVARVARGIIRLGRDIGRVAKRTIHRILGRTTASDRHDEHLLSALATESKLPLRDHLTYWIGTILGVIAIPLIPVLVPVAIVVWWTLKAMRRLVAIIARYVERGLRWTVARLTPSARKAKQDALRATSPIRQRGFRIARMIEMIDAAYRVDANVYQANDFDTLVATWITSRLRGVPFVYDIHELYDESFPTRKPFRVRYGIRLIEKRLIRRAIRTITVGNEIARIMHERYGVPRPAVIRNAQPYEGRPEPVPFLRDAIGDTDRPNRRKLFVYAGRLARGRGLEESVEAMREIDPDSAALVILGDGDPARKRSLEALVKQHQLQDRVYLIPAIPSSELPGVLADADIGLMLTQPACLSYYYGLGNKMFHYVNAGIPVLVPRQPEKARFVEHYSVGVCCETLTPEGIAAAMQDLLDRPEWVATLGERCHEVAPTVSWQREAATYRGIYEDVYERVLFGAVNDPTWSLA